MLCWYAQLAKQSSRAFLNKVLKILSWLGNPAEHSENKCKNVLPE
jgi:hypothetical protein